MANAIVLVPPFLKLVYGPVLGPAMLIGAGRRAGHEVRLLDLNATWIRERLPNDVALGSRAFIGDHDRPAALTELHRAFKRELALQEPSETHEKVASAARRLANGVFGAWVDTELAHAPAIPDVIGVSVMYRDQVEPALAITMAARRRWPRALVVWGGAHVTALRDEVAMDARYACEAAIDRFVFGYAEQTWVDLLDALTKHSQLPKEVVRAGCGLWLPALDDGSVVPVFGDVTLYDAKLLTLPVQSSRGCRYGKCAYCTYPSIEGDPRDLPWEAIDCQICFAVRLRATLSFKDSLVGGERLEELGERIRGRVRWSASTKLDARLPGRLERLAAGGLRTLEIGLETIEPRAQSLILKRQSAETFYRFLDTAASAKIAVVVNYITGLPGIDPIEEQRCKAVVGLELEVRRPNLVSKLEHNSFQLERLSPMGRAPERFGIRVTRRTPWASVLEWEPTDHLVPFG